MQSYRILVSAFTMILPLFALASQQSQTTYKEHAELEYKPSTPGALIIDNSMGKPGSFGIVTNMRTGLDEDSTQSAQGCENEDETRARACNSFELENGASLQVIQQGTSGVLSVESGVFNQQSTSYENFGKDTQARLFEADNHLFDIDKFRNAAKELRKSNTNLAPFTYGNITWQQFIENVAAARTMYGIVRVEIPLQRLSDAPPVNNKKGKKRYSSRSGKRYGFCGQSKLNTCGCSPGVKIEGGGDEDYEETEIKPGETICGVKLPSFSRIDVRGSILFDWVDCDTREPIKTQDLPESAEDLEIEVSVPLIINPAYPGSNFTLNNMQDITALSAEKTCAPDQSCSFPLEIPVSALSFAPPPEYSRFNKQFTGSEFAQLSMTDRYASLLPSGYVKGWEAAFQQLNITGKTWRDLNFQTPTADNDIISYADIRADGTTSTGFEDIPSFMYTGGLFKLEHHINVSGLMYIPQAFDLEQNGIDLEKRVKKHDEEYEKKDKEYSKYSYFKKKYVRESDYHNHEYARCPKKTDHYEIRIPASQYISGAVVVRDGFSIEVEDEGGATIISNDPASFDNMRASGSGGLVQRFRPFKKELVDNGTDNGTGNGNSGNANPGQNGGSGSGQGNGGGNNGGGNNNGGNGSNQSNRPTTPLWMEIRPR